MKDEVRTLYSIVPDYTLIDTHGELYGVTVFEPQLGNRDIKNDYPELKKYEEFSGLRNVEILFCWYFGNQTSPFYPLKDTRTKSYKSLLHSGLLDIIQGNVMERDKYLRGDFPPKIQVAIAKMSSFRPDLRIRGRLMQEEIFNNYSKIVTQDVSTMTLEERKEYAKMTADITKMIATLIGEIENLYGARIIPLMLKNLADATSIKPIDMVVSSDEINEISKNL